jgi:hypothetical protein
MNDIFQCGDSAALVAYLYDECALDEQVVIASHLKGCVACSSEMDSLRATRRTLAAWTPPELALGFRITRENEPRPAKVLEPKIAWWRAPMPAWAQAAAALLIFGAGLSVGAVRNTPTMEPAVTPQTASILPVDAQPVAPSVSQGDLDRLEQRIKAELSTMRSSNTATPVVARGSNDDLMTQVKSLIEQSEENQRRDFTLRMVDLAGNIETQRRVDLATVRQQLGVQERSIGTELRQQREVLGRLVSERTR